MKRVIINYIDKAINIALKSNIKSTSSLAAFQPKEPCEVRNMRKNRNS